ncbi:hypothetical protein C8R46DRAFT_1063391 [Mycena filopes]|nr:hypothetical protein C8R46DRAFT_1063391 [Mycena filopes]
MVSRPLLFGPLLALLLLTVVRVPLLLLLLLPIRILLARGALLLGRLVHVYLTPFPLLFLV